MAGRCKKEGRILHTVHRVWYLHGTPCIFCFFGFCVFSALWIRIGFNTDPELAFYLGADLCQTPLNLFYHNFNPINDIRDGFVALFYSKM
jgi:hypothetical protein